jgi:hypothetical protein
MYIVLSIISNLEMSEGMQNVYRGYMQITYRAWTAEGLGIRESPGTNPPWTLKDNSFNKMNFLSLSRKTINRE